jgi:excisionase family DNA binding protein
VATWLTAREVAAVTKIGKRTVLRAAREGQLRAAKVGGRGEIRVRSDWADEWLENLARAEAGTR